jgi:WD40 repeat protein
LDVEVPLKHFSRAPWEKEVGLISFEAIERTISKPSARKDGDSDSL